MKEEEKIIIEEEASRTPKVSGVDQEKMTAIVEMQNPHLSKNGAKKKAEKLLEEMVNGTVPTDNIDATYAEANRLRADYNQKKQQEIDKLLGEAHKVTDLRAAGNLYLSLGQKFLYSLLNVLSEEKADQYLESNRDYLSVRFKQDDIKLIEKYRDGCKELSMTSQQRLETISKELGDYRKNATKLYATVRANDRAVSELGMQTDNAETVHDIEYLKQEMRDANHQLTIIDDNTLDLEVEQMQRQQEVKKALTQYHTSDRLLNLIRLSEENFKRRQMLNLTPEQVGALEPRISEMIKKYQQARVGLLQIAANGTGSTVYDPSNEFDLAGALKTAKEQRMKQDSVDITESETHYRNIMGHRT